MTEGTPKGTISDELLGNAWEGFEDETGSPKKPENGSPDANSFPTDHDQSAPAPKGETEAGANQAPTLGSDETNPRVEPPNLRRMPTIPPGEVNRKRLERIFGPGRKS